MPLLPDPVSGLCLSLLAASVLAQPLSGLQGQGDGPRSAAAFAGGEVSWDEFHLELARRHRGKPLGKQALEHVIDRTIVEFEAEARKLVIPEAEVSAKLAEVRRHARTQNISLEEFLRKKGLTIAQFRRYVNLSLLNERLARKDLGLGPGDALDSGQLKLWATDMRRRYAVVIDPAKLPSQVCARVKDRELSLVTLGSVMDRNLSSQDREAILKQMIAYRLLRKQCRERGVEVKSEDIDNEVERRREEFRRNPKLRGLELEDFLKASGRTLADLREGEVFRAQILISLLGEKLFPIEEVDKDYERDPATWHGRVGVSRHGFRIFVQGRPRRSMEEAKRVAEDLTKQIRDRSSFQFQARRASEDPRTRRVAGDMGFLHREEKRYSEALRKALFALPLNKVSDPVREPDGFSLLFVTELDPGPQGKQLLRAIQRYKMGDYLTKLVKESNFRIAQR